MNAAQKMVGKTYKHPELGLIIVNKALSKVKVEITCIDRGTYDETKGKYEKRKKTRPNVSTSGKVVGTTVYWTHYKSTTQYLHKDECHIKCLQ